MSKIMEVKDLTKKFKNFTAVNKINFSINKGEILGFLGPNGAGKTTTIKMINGLIKVSSGQIIINNQNVVKFRSKIKEMIGYMSQKFSLYPALTGEENLEFFGGISGLGKDNIKKKIEELKVTLPLNFLNRKVSDIPPGKKQEISLFASMISDPQILFLDEPTSGVDPENRRKFWHKIYTLKEQGKTILVTTHSLDEAEYADRIIIIHRGNIIERGEPDALCNNYGVDSIQEVFLKAVNEK